MREKARQATARAPAHVAGRKSVGSFLFDLIDARVDCYTTALFNKYVVNTKRSL